MYKFASHCLYKFKYLLAFLMRFTCLYNFLSFALLLLSPFSLCAQSTLSDSIQQYYVTGWNSDNGLTSNAVLSINQTDDGFLWVGTYDGLLRFDGVRFNRIDSKYENIFKTSGVLNISIDRKKNAWFGTNGGGLAVYDQHRFKEFKHQLLEGESINRVLEDSKGTLWIGTRLHLFSYDRKVLSKVHFDTIKNFAANDLVEDADGFLWVGTEKDGLLKVKNGKLVAVFNDRNGLPSNSINKLLYIQKEDKIWIATDNGLGFIKTAGMKVVQPVPAKLLKHPYQSASALFWDDKKDELWVGTDDGLFAIKNGIQKTIPNFTKEFVISLHKDEEDNLWAGTYREGLFKIRPSPFICYESSDGLVNNVVNSIYEHSDGSLWIGTDGGLSVLRKGVFKNFTEAEGLISNRVRDVAELADGSVLIATYSGASIFKNGKVQTADFEKKLPANKIRRIFKDTDGSIWLGMRSGLTQVNADGSVRNFTKKDGLSDDYIMALTRTEEHGLVICTNSGGLNFYQNGKFKSLTIADGLPSNIIFDAYQDGEKRLWVATNEGLACIQKNGKIKVIKRTDGLDNDVIFNIIPDGKGFYWMGCNRGIFKVKSTELVAFVEGKIKKVSCMIFRKTEGLISDEVTATGRAAMVRGGLVFPTIKGIASINPDKFHVNLKVPKVAIEHLTLNGQEKPIHDGQVKEVKVGPDIRYLNIKFTALSFIVPEKVRFKYRLYPFEKEWIEVLNEREARYTNLPHGQYTFQVMAANNDGVWNEQYASLRIEKQPFFYQTKLFITLVVLLVLAGGVTAYRLRMRALAIDKERLERLVAERTRKAEELTEQVSLQATQIAQAYKKTSDSIHYARRLQNALVPSEATIAAEYPHSFFIYKPKDVISGDFAWFTQHPESNIVVLGDCTGHGVPGAFMTVVAHNLLQQIVVENEIISPALILKQLDFSLKNILNQNTDTQTVNDGIDLAICAISPDQKSVSFAGAMNSIYIWRKDEGLKQYKGDRFPIGSNFYNEKFFTNQYIELNEGDTIYMITDGFQDQFGGELSRKYMVKRLREFISEMGALTMPEQSERFENEYLNWKRDYEQTDDVSILAIRIAQ